MTSTALAGGAAQRSSAVAMVADCSVGSELLLWLSAYAFSKHVFYLFLLNRGGLVLMRSFKKKNIYIKTRSFVECLNVVACVSATVDNNPS